MRGGSNAILGAMLESNIEAGNQPLTENRAALKYGVSITDPCIDWATTERCLTEAAVVARLAQVNTGADARGSPEEPNEHRTTATNRGFRQT